MGVSEGVGVRTGMGVETGMETGMEAGMETGMGMGMDVGVRGDVPIPASGGVRRGFGRPRESGNPLISVDDPFAPRM